MALAGATLKGNPAAKVALIEYSDFQCPFCGKFARETLPMIEKVYIEPGKVLLAFKHLPLQSIHPFAAKASEAALCAGREGKFWLMHDKLFEGPVGLDTPSLLISGDSIGVESRAFRSCLADGETASQVRADAEEARRLGITGTPAFLYGELKNGAVNVVGRISGAREFDEFRLALDRLLGAAQAR